MCTVLVEKSDENVGFILYNLVFSKDTSIRFTVKELRRELDECGFSIPEETIEGQIRNYISSGLLNQNFKSYSVRPY